MNYNKITKSLHEKSSKYPISNLYLSRKEWKDTVEENLSSCTVLKSDDRQKKIYKKFKK